MTGLLTDGDSAYHKSLNLINALCNKQAYAHEIAPVRVVETHISWVLLTGYYAYKIKKPVCFGFLDFSTLEKRYLFCREELRLNQRLAGQIYLDVVPITSEPGHPKVDGQLGPVVEYAVKMCQFADGRLFSQRAENGVLSRAEIDQIAPIIANFHLQIEKAKADSAYGDPVDIKHWMDENFVQMESLLVADYDRRQLKLIQCWGDEEWASKSALMKLRKQQGFVRECHGDLHLSNITLIEGNAVMFDCIEFNPMLRWIDVISEIAFLMIDLCYFGHEPDAFRTINHYLEYTGDYSGLALLPFYLVYRALVMAKISLLRIQQCQQDERQLAQKKFSAFIALATRFMQPKKALLIITHGYSGSGKSNIAEQLAEIIGAIQLRSDVERKRLFGFPVLGHSDSGIADGIYSQYSTIATYERLATLAKDVITSGFTAIVDASFLQIKQRDRFRRLAKEMCVGFVILDLWASNEALSTRIRSRVGDASEATLEVLGYQRSVAQPLSEMEMASVIGIDTEDREQLGLALEKVRCLSC
jgi:aminoglycoside phosphotransferase family enzyme/predicted kinase